MKKHFINEIEQLKSENKTLKTELAALQDNYKITNHLLNNSTVLAWMVNTNLEFTFISPAFIKCYETLLSIKPELGGKAIGFFQNNQKQTWAERFEKALAGESFQAEELIGNKDGDKFFRLFISPMIIQGQTQGVQVYINEITGLKEAEKNESFNLRKLREIFNQIQDLYYEVTIDGIITELSPAIKNFSKYDRTELIGKDVIALYRNEVDREIFINTIKQKGSIKDHVVEFIDKDGASKKFSVNATLIHDQQGTPDNIVGTMRDITEIEKKNKDLRWLRRSIENSPLSIIITDIKGNIEYTNPFFTKTTGYTKEEVISKNPSLLKSGNHTDSFYNKMWTTILNGKVWEGEFYNKRKNGTFFTEKAIISPVKNNDGQIINFIAIKEDITQAKQATREIERLKSLNDLIINTINEGILVEDADGKILFTNPAFSQMTGYPIDKLIGKKWEKIIDEKFHNNIYNNENSNSDRKNEFFESKLKCKDGKSIPVIISGSPIKDGRKDMGLISVFTDITRLKKNEEKLKEALEKAQLSDKLKTSFLANMSHEIRTPMNSILGFSEILRHEKKLEDPLREEYFSIIEQKGNQLLQIISDLIDISKIEAKMVTIDNEETAIHPLLEGVFETFKKELPIYEKQSLKLSKVVPSHSNTIFVKTDKNRLIQIILNLLSNARKFTNEGEIIVGYSVHEHYLEFFVKDTGIGISKENQEIIFDRFRQADDKYTREFGGTGLGLNICKNLIIMMGGDIRVESEVNKGSCFFFTLPL